MKRTPLLAVLLPLLCLLSACGKTEPVALLPEGVGDDCGLRLYRWDGSTIQSKFVFESQETSEIIAELSVAGTPGKKSLEPPENGAVCWGLRFVFEWEDFEAAWYDGVWSDSDGRNLQVDLDFAAIWEMSGEEPRTWDSEGLPNGFPNQRLLALQNGTWNAAFLSKSKEADTDPNIYLTCALEKDGSLTCILHNGGMETLSMGEYYWLQVQVDGVWYYVPQASTEHYGYGFDDIGYWVKSGGTYNFSPWIEIYLPLPDGAYRIAKSCDGDNLATAEFSIVKGEIQVP